MFDGFNFEIVICSQNSEIVVDRFVSEVVVCSVNTNVVLKCFGYAMHVNSCDAELLVNSLIFEYGFNRFESEIAQTIQKV